MAVTVQESVSSLREEFFKKCASVEAELKRASDAGTQDVSALVADFANYKANFVNTITILQKQVDILARNIDRLEMRSRRKILLVHGISESDKEDVAQVVVRVVRSQLAIAGFTDKDIRRCHRMGRQSSTLKPRPILCKFESAGVRDKVWSIKKKLKGSGVTISEFLTKARHAAFMAARQKFPITQSWTQGGQVYVLDNSGKRHRVETIDDVNKIPTSASHKPDQSDSVALHTRPRRNVSAKK